MKVTEKKTNSGSRNELVAVTRTLVNNVEPDVALFVLNFPQKYSPTEYWTKLLEQADKVADLPLPLSRIAVRRNARIALLTYNVSVMESSRLLTKYIQAAFPSSYWEAQLNGAGIAAYMASRNRVDFNANIDCLLYMTTYVAANSAVLLDPGSMPTVFPTNLAALKDKYTLEFNTYSEGNNSSLHETTDVNAQVLDLRKKVDDILTDGQSIFYSNPAKRNSYTFAALRRQTLPLQITGGIRFGLRDSSNQRPIADAVVSTSYFNKTVTSDSKGRVNMHQLPEGTYTLTVVAKDYVTFVLENIKVKKGVQTTIRGDVYLMPQLTEAAKSKIPNAAAAEVSATVPEPENAPQAEETLVIEADNMVSPTEETSEN